LSRRSLGEGGCIEPNGRVTVAGAGSGDESAWRRRRSSNERLDGTAATPFADAPAPASGSFRLGDFGRKLSAMRRAPSDLALINQCGSGARIPSAFAEASADQSVDCVIASGDVLDDQSAISRESDGGSGSRLAALLRRLN